MQQASSNVQFIYHTKTLNSKGHPFETNLNTNLPSLLIPTSRVVAAARHSTIKRILDMLFILFIRIWGSSKTPVAQTASRLCQQLSGEWSLFPQREAKQKQPIVSKLAVRSSPNSASNFYPGVLVAVDPPAKSFFNFWRFSGKQLYFAKS